ncbi:MAG: glycosyltransferase family 4 protein [Candidatus Diapherotrites archaeon]
MKIFFITHTYSLKEGGGGEIFVSGYLRELRKRNHEIMVFTPHSADYSEEEKRLGIKTVYAPVFGHHALHKFQYLLFAFNAVKLAKEFKPDIIHAQNDAIPGIIGHLIKKEIKKPMILALEGLSNKGKSLNLKLVYAVNKFFLPKLNYDKIVSWSKFVKENFLLKWGIESEKISVIPGGIELEKFFSVKSTGKFEKKFGKKFFASVKPLNKNNADAIAFVIKAMKIVSEKHPEYKYVIAGEGNEKAKLEELAKKLGIEKNIVFAGWIDSEELPELYASSDFTVHSFIFRASTSIALLESMASGKAVVATESGEIKSIVKDSGILAKPENPESIADAIIKLIENPAMKKEMGLKARKIAEENYSIKSVADKFEKLYNELIEKQKK